MQISASGNPFLSFLPLFIYLFKAVFLLPKKKVHCRTTRRFRGAKRKKSFENCQNLHVGMHIRINTETLCF